MPIFDQGYRPYEGTLVNRLFRWWPISITCLKTVKRRPFVMLLIASLVPLIVQLVKVWLASEGHADELGGIPIEIFWRLNDALFFELFYSEIFFTALLMIVVGAGQIAEDFRTGAQQIYFSRPITHVDYVLGKLGAVVMAGLLTTFVPALILFVLICGLAPDWTFLTGNPWLPLKFTGFALVISVTLGSLVLAISALGRRGLFVGITFGGIYFLSMILGQVLPRVFDRDRRWEVVHIGKALDAVGLTFFDRSEVFTLVNRWQEPQGEPGAAWMIVAGLVLFSLVVLSRKIRAVEVVS